MMFSLSFVWGSKSASGFGPGESISPSRFGPGGPNLGGSKSAWTPRDDVSSYLKYYQLSSEILDYIAKKYFYYISSVLSGVLVF